MILLRVVHLTVKGKSVDRLHLVLHIFEHIHTASIFSSLYTGMEVIINK